MLRQALCQYISLVLFSGMLLPSLKTQAQKNSEDTTKPKLEIFEMKINTITRSFGGHEVRPPVIEDFDGTGEYDFHVSIYGNIYSRCLVIINAVNRQSGEVKKVLNSSYAGGIKLYEGDLYKFSLGYYNYKVNIEKCPRAPYSSKEATITIERTITENPALISDNLIWEMTGKLKEEVVDVDIREINWAVIENYGLSIANSREIAFEKSVAKSYGGGVNIGLFEGELGGQVSKAREAKFEQIEEESRTATLDGQRCKTWLIKKIKISEYGKVSAPKLGITDQLDMTVVRGFFYEAEPLCDEHSGSNDPVPKLVSQARQEIVTFKTDKQKKK